MFYYGTGNILHDDHRFIECGTGHFMNHLSHLLTLSAEGPHILDTIMGFPKDPSDFGVGDLN